MDSYLSNKFTNQTDQTEEIPEAVNVPILSKIEPGKPLLAEENIQKYFPFPDNCGLFNGYDVIGLRIAKQQLLFNGMYLDDVLLVELNNSIVDGDRVVAMINDQAISGRFVMGKDRFIVKPEHKAYEMFTSDSFTIIGKVIGSVRFME